MNKNAYVLFTVLIFTLLPASLYCQDYTRDSLAVRAILDSNGLDSITVASVTDSSGGRIWRLRLRAKNLTIIPPEIGNLTGLKELELRNNTISTLPPETGNLTEMTRLYLSFNNLSSLPPDIGNLTRLTILYIFFNELTSLPSEIGNLTNLAVLCIEGNHLTVLPPEVGNLGKLGCLTAHENDITSIPPEIGNLASLVELNLARNELVTLPDSIVNLTPTVKLDLGYNKLDNTNLSDTVIIWADTYDPDWRDTQPVLFNSRFPLKSQGNLILRYIHKSIITIQYYLPSSENVLLEVSDLKGKLLLTLCNTCMQAGHHSVNWESARFGSGVYYIKLSTGNNTVVQKAIVTK